LLPIHSYLLPPVSYVFIVYVIRDINKRHKSIIDLLIFTFHLLYTFWIFPDVFEGFSKSCLIIVFIFIYKVLVVFHYWLKFTSNCADIISTTFILYSTAVATVPTEEESKSKYIYMSYSKLYKE